MHSGLKKRVIGLLSIIAPLFFNGEVHQILSKSSRIGRTRPLCIEYREMAFADQAKRNSIYTRLQRYVPEITSIMLNGFQDA